MFDTDDTVTTDREEPRDDSDHLTECAACGGTIVTTEWHAVRGVTDDDGDFRLYAFCDRDCRSAWTGPGET